MSLKDGFARLLKNEKATRGVDVTLKDGGAVIDFHIIVAYGVNIKTVADNLMENVIYRVENFIGLPFETTAALWRKLLSRYLETEDEALLRSVEDKAKVVGYARLLRHVLRRNGMATEAGRRQIETYRAALEELLARTDTLLF